MIQFVCIMDDIGVVNIITILADHKLQQILEFMIMVLKSALPPCRKLQQIKIAELYPERKLRML